jgi:hypothetical protein
MTIDVLQRDDLLSPHSLPEFQRLFPEKRLARPIWKGIVGKMDLSAPTAMHPAILIDFPIVLASFVAVIANILRI